jgi:hypothetical protein
VLEEMGESGFSRLDFVPGTGPDNGVIRNNVGVGKRDGDHLQPVFEFLDLIAVRKNIGALEKRRDGEEKEGKKGESDKFKHG